MDRTCLSWMLDCVILASIGAVCAAAGDLDAYYCKLDSGYSWESAFRAGSDADVAVVLGDPAGRLMFWRASSYLPHWKTTSGMWYLDEILARSGDGSGVMPDRFCQYSRARIIENTAARVVVHWRYAPNFGNVDHDGFADEYFSVYPDGLCVRSVRRPAARLDDWSSAANVTIQRLRLEASGISDVTAQWQGAPALFLRGNSHLAYESYGFDEKSGCYVLRSKRNVATEPLEFRLEGAVSSPVRNPAFVVRNFGDGVPGVSVTGAILAGRQTGFAGHARGEDLVLWLKVESTGTVDISIFGRGSSTHANRAPDVSAGENISILVPSGSSGPYTVQLAGSVEDDDLPSGSLSIAWSHVSGPATAGFHNASLPGTQVDLPTAGTYKLRLAAGDGGLNGQDDVLVTVRQDPGTGTAPAAWWRFDEGTGSTTVESIGGRPSQINGNKALWAAGVCGTSLVFDGYPSVVVHPQADTPAISGPFTLEAWVAIQAYPWNWCPIVHRSQWESSGWWLGIDEEGHLSLKASIGGSWRSATSSASVGLYKWVHVAGTYDGETMRVYIDGSERGSTGASGSVSATSADLKIGKGRDMPPTMPIRDGYECSYAIDGAIDEVRIYNRALSGAEVLGRYNATRPAALAVSNPPAQKPVLPYGPPDADRFRAYYTNIEFHDAWDNLWRVSEHPDVVVQFDEVPYKYVFWRGMRYIPHLVSENNIWYNNQFNEARSDGGCAEPMSDNDCRHSHVRIIHASGARAVIHWRYALENVIREMVFEDPATGWNDFTDEYHYVYPDGVVLRKIHLWSTEPTEHHEWHEVIVVTGPGTWPMDNIEHDALYLAHMDGSSRSYSWYDPDNHDDIMDDSGNIFLTNLRAQFDPFAIVEPEGAGNDGAGGWGSGRPYPYYNHWPVAQIPSDGRYCFTNERTAHTSLTHIEWPYHDLGGNYAEKIMLTGSTEKTAGQLVPLTKSWSSPPQLAITSPGFSGGQYDKTQRAYMISQDAPSDILSFTLQCSSGSPMVNACFIVEGWGSDEAALKIDGGEIQPGPLFRQGLEKKLDQPDSLVVWVKKESTSAVSFEVSRSSTSATDFNRDGVTNFLDLATFHQGM